MTEEKRTGESANSGSITPAATSGSLAASVAINNSGSLSQAASPADEVNCQTCTMLTPTSTGFCQTCGAPLPDPAAMSQSVVQSSGPRAVAPGDIIMTAQFNSDAFALELGGQLRISRLASDAPEWEGRQIVIDEQIPNSDPAQFYASRGETIITAEADDEFNVWVDAAASQSVFVVVEVKPGHNRSFPKGGTVYPTDIHAVTVV